MKNIRFSLRLAPTSPNLRKLSLFAALTGALLSCGKPKGGDGGGPGMGKVEAAFVRTSNASGVPSRMLLAISWVESRISPEFASAFYLENDARFAKSLRLTQSAFGLPLSTFGLEPGNDDAAKLEVQIDRYGKWVQSRLGELKLDPHPSSSDDKAQWVMRLSELHRDSKVNKRNLQALFAREVIATLNSGFIWQDPKTGEVLKLPREEPSIKLNELKPATRKQLEVNTLTGDVPGTRFFQLTHTDQPRGNEGKRVEVVHCPLGLSACLMLQDATEEEVQFGAHIAIPDMLSPDLMERPIQIHDLHEVVKYTGADGKPAEVKDAIVVMLTGNSGRYVDGTRIRANPGWLGESQLQMMGTVINDVCGTIHTDDDAARDRCVAADGQDSVNFHRQDFSRAYQWGEIADFEPSIFNSYLRDPGRKAGTAFEFPDQRRQFRAGEPVNFAVSFGNNAKAVVIQRLVRCLDDRLTWDKEVAVQPRSQNRWDFANLLRWYDGGPNRNGEQFVRAMVYGSQNELLGWAIDTVHLTDFEKEKSKDGSAAPVAPTVCGGM